MRKTVIASAALLFAFGAQAAVLIHQDFNSATPPTAYNSTLVPTRDAAQPGGAVLDKGWYQQTSNVWNWDAANGGLNITASEFKLETGMQLMMGQMNTDNKATKGLIKFEFTITKFLNWDADDRVKFHVDVFGNNDGWTQFNQNINLSVTGLSPVAGVGSAWTHIVSVGTAVIDGTVTGAFLTDEIDLGTGWNYLAFRIAAVSVSGTLTSGDTLILSRVDAISGGKKLFIGILTN